MQLLAHVLAVLHPSERFGSAALVATAWHTAAVLGTDSIRLSVSAKSAAVPKRFEDLSVWLAANSHAGITHLEATMPLAASPLEQLPMLQLPALQRLPGLECLRCCGLAITTAPSSSTSEATAAEAPGAAAADAAAATDAAWAAAADALGAAADATGTATAGAATAATVLPLQLSAVTALTALQLHSCIAEVQGLSALTSLQTLTLGAPILFQMQLPNTYTSKYITQLYQALPRLQGLVSLQLIGVLAHDDLLRHVTSLSRLQNLELVDGIFTLASFQQLPQSLTRLNIEWEDDDTSVKTLTASTVPGLAALTGLQHLAVCAAPANPAELSVDVLVKMPSLRHLDLGKAWLVEPGKLSGLTALTQLTLLNLASMGEHVAFDVDAAVFHAELAAITASTQLRWLDLVDATLGGDACRHMFPASKQLTQLTRLHAGLELISDSIRASFVATCCPNLEYIYLGPCQDEVWEGPEGTDAALARMLRCWQPLQHLTSLTLAVGGYPVTPEVWQAMGRLTQLLELKVSSNNLQHLAGVVHVSSLTRLKSLTVDGRSMEGMMDHVLLEVKCEQVS